MKKESKTDFDKVVNIINEKTTYSLLEDNISKNEKDINKKILFMINNEYSCVSCSFDNNDNIIFISLIKKSFSDELHRINNCYNHVNTYINNITDKFDNFFDIILKEIIFYEPERHVFNFIKSIGLDSKKDFIKYIEYDNINANITTKDNYTSVITFNRFSIPIKLIYINDNLSEILIYNKNNKSYSFYEFNNLTDYQPMPSILISSFMNYFLKK